MTLKHNLKELLRIAIPHSYSYETPSETETTVYIKNLIEELQQLKKQHEKEQSEWYDFQTEGYLKAIDEILGDSKK